jgi:hypothetical protein
MTAVRYRAASGVDAAKVAEAYLASRKAHLPYAPLAHSDDEVRLWIRDVLIPAGRVTVVLEGNDIVGMMATNSGSG